MNRRDLWLVTGGGAAGSFWAWFFAGNPLRGLTAVVLYGLIVGAVELVAYLSRHIRWQ